MSLLKHLLILALVVLLVAFPISAVAQNSASSDWSAVRQLTTDTKISVRLKTGRSLEGKIANVSDGRLTLTKSKQGEIKRDDIQSVYQLVRKSATSSTLIGMGIGAGAGAGLGAAADVADDSGFEKVNHAATAGLAVVGAVAGAVSGYFIGKKPTKVLVYDAR